MRGSALFPTTAVYAMCADTVVQSTAVGLHRRIGHGPRTRTLGVPTAVDTYHLFVLLYSCSSTYGSTLPASGRRKLRNTQAIQPHTAVLPQVLDALRLTLLLTVLTVSWDPRTNPI